MTSPGQHGIQYPVLNRQQQTISLEKDKLEDKLHSLHEEYNQMPECFDKSVLCILYYTKLKSIRNPVFKQLIIPDQLESLITQELQTLKNCYIKEKQCHDDFNYQIKQISKLIDEGQWSETVSYLEEILKRVRRLNIQEMNRLTQKAIEAGKTLKNKDVILLLGVTGSGKSTTIHFLSGSKMAIKDYEVSPGNTIQYIAPDQSSDIPELNNVTISPTAESETLYITSVPILYKDIGMDKNVEIYLLDTAGFEDTRGPEVDIANGIGIVEALKGCKSVRPVILFSHLSMGDRGQGIRSLAHIIVNMFAHIQDKLSSLVYAFTKFPSSVNNIQAHLINIRNKIDNEDTALINLFDDMISKTKQNIIRIDPLNDSPGNIMEQILRFGAINNPQETFIFSITESSNYSLESQINKNKNIIQNAIDQDDYELANYMLDQIKLLKDILSLQSIKNNYDNCVVQATSKITQKYQSVQKQFNEQLETQGELSVTSIKSYKDEIDKIRASEKLNENHLNKQVPLSSGLTQNIIHRVKLTCQQLETIVDINDAKIKISLDNIKRILDQFTEVKPQYEQMCNYIKDKLSQMYMEQTQLIQNNQFGNVGINLTKLKKLFEYLGDHVDIKQIEQQNELVIQQIFGDLKGIEQTVNDILRQTNIQYKDIQQLGQVINKLQQVKDTGELRDYIQVSDIQLIYSKVQEQIMNYFKQKIYNVNELLSKENKNSFQEIKVIVDELIRIRTIPEIEIYTSQIYHQLVQIIIGKIQKIKSEVETLLLHEHDGNINFSRIDQCFNTLQNMQWLNELKPGIYEDAMQDFKDKLISYVETIRYQIDALDIDIHNNENLRKVQILLQNVEEIKKYKKFYSTIVNEISIIQQKCVSKIKVILQEILGNYNSGNNLLMQKNELKQIELEELEKIIEKYDTKITQEFVTDIDMQDQGTSKIQKLKKEISKIEEKLAKCNEVEQYYQDKLNKQRNIFKKTLKTVRNVMGKGSEIKKLQEIGFSNIQQLQNKIKELNNELEDKRNQLNKENIIQNQDTRDNKPIMIQNTQKAQKYIQQKGYKNLEELEQAIKDKKNEITRLEQAQYENGQFSGYLIEKQLKFAENCRQVMILKEKANEVVQYLQKNVLIYGKQIRKEIQECLNKIIKPKPEQIKEIYNYGNVLCNIVQELQELKELTIVYDLIRGKQIFSEFTRKLTSYQIELEQIQDLQQKIEISKALSQLDQFSEIKFIELYRVYYKLFQEENKEIQKEILDSIEEYNYMNVANCLMEIGQSNVPSKIKQRLIGSISKVTYQAQGHIQMCRIQLDINTVRIIIVDLERIQSARVYLMDYIDQNIMQRLIDIQEQIESIIQGRLLKQIEDIEKFVNLIDFSEAEDKLGKLVEIRNILGNWCVPEQYDQRIDDLKNKLTSSIEQFFQEMETRKLEDYQKNPPIKDTLKKMEKISNQNYSGRIEQIKINIIYNCKELLEKAKQEYPDERNYQLVKNILVTLPKDTQIILEKELDQFNNEIIIKQKECKKEYEQLKVLGDSNRISKLLDDIQTNGMKDVSAYVMEDILMQGRDYTSRINEELNYENIRNALDIFKKSLQYFEIFSKKVNGVSNLLIDIQEYFSNAFNKICGFIACIETIENTELMEIKFDNLTLLVKEYKEYSTKGIHLFREDLYSLNNLSQKLHQYISNYQEYYQKGIHECNIQFIRDSMNVFKKWNRLLQNIKSYCGSENERSFLVRYLSDTVSTCISYQDMQRDVIEYLKEIETRIIQFDIFKGLEKQRDEKYKELDKNVVFLRKAKELKNHFVSGEFDINKFEKECLGQLSNKFQYVGERAIKLMQKSNLSRSDCNEFCVYFDNMKSFDKFIKSSGIDIKSQIEDIESRVLDKVQQLQNQIEQPKIEKQQIAQCLIQMKILADNIMAFKIKIEERIETVLKDYRTRNRGDGMAIALLGGILEADLSGVGLTIISEYSCFKGQAISLFNQETQRYTIDIVLEKLTGDSLDKDILREHYEQFNYIYKRIVEDNVIQLEKKLQTTEQINRELISKIKLLPGSIKHTPTKVNWSSDIQHKIPNIIAHIFTLWTLKNTSYYLEMKDVKAKRNNYLLQPHPGQVISIFRMLGLGYKNEKLQSNLIQIGTGEGKSVTLGVTSATLALLGINVSCACYSEYLSQRDYNAFLPIFEDLGVADQISYGTFNKLCEQIINESGDIRTRVINLVNNSTAKEDKKQLYCNNPRILLIDEVDVFFSEDFYSSVYTPLAILRDQVITALTNYIWENAKKGLTLRQIVDTKEYGNCCKRFNGWEFLIKEAIKDMLVDVKNYSHDYLVQNDKIVYKEQDGVSSDISYGYKTLFAYYYENKQGRISKESLDNKIGIGIHCGSYSYKEIPFKFQCIMGVTGTLKTLSKPEKNIIENVYNIKMNTYMASVFGENKRIFAKVADVLVENQIDYFNTLIEQIRNRIVSGKQQNRAVLIFFETKKRLMEFYESEKLSPLKDGVQIMTEEISLQEKDLYIRRASTSGQITLLTRVFGRGTDFICRDQTVIASGGVHVIQTFLSEEYSEEVQIMGRCARQGQNGSYSMVLLDQDLEKYLGPDYMKDIEEMRKNANFYEILDQKRNLLFEKKYFDIEQNAKNSEKKHEQGIKFIENLNKNDINKIRQFLGEENKGAESKICSNTIILMDATGSLMAFLTQVKLTIGVVIERVSDILEDKKIPSDCFQLQLVVYRDYDCKIEGILEKSPWENKPENLRKFMQNITAYGGNDYEEAIEIGLQYANYELEQLEGQSQVILMGDAPAKSVKAIKQYRAEYGGESYWKSSKFKEETHFQNEIEKLKKNNIPVHSFYLDKGAKSNFEQIAQFTNGKSSFLDINSSKGSDVLCAVIAEQILLSVGQSQGDNGELIVKAYRNKYGKCFI